MRPFNPRGRQRGPNLEPHVSESNGYLSPFIGDGYDKEATIPEIPGRWSAVRIRYRPMSADEESQCLVGLRLAPQQSMVRNYAEIMATKIIDWDIKDRDGKKLPVTADTICGLSPGFYDAIKAIVVDGVVMPSGESEAVADTKNS